MERLKNGRLALRLSRNFANPPELSVINQTREAQMATTTRGRNQDRARVAAGQDHEVAHEAKKEGVSKTKVKDAVKSVGNSRNKVEGKLKK
jgi:hypothetical protein